MDHNYKNVIMLNITYLHPFINYNYKYVIQHNKKHNHNHKMNA